MFIVEVFFDVKVWEDKIGRLMVLDVQLFPQHLETLRRVFVLIDVLHTPTCTKAAVCTS